MRHARVPASAVLPEAAWVYELLAGGDPNCRLPGWFLVLSAGRNDEPDAIAVWEQHAPALTALARQHNFEPFHLTRKRPKGESFEEWRRQFLAQHKY